MSTTTATTTTTNDSTFDLPPGFQLPPGVTDLSLVSDFKVSIWLLKKRPKFLVF